MYNTRTRVERHLKITDLNQNVKYLFVMPKLHHFHPIYVMSGIKLLKTSRPILHRGYRQN